HHRGVEPVMIAEPHGQQGGVCSVLRVFMGGGPVNMHRLAEELVAPAAFLVGLAEAAAGAAVAGARPGLARYVFMPAFPGVLSELMDLPGQLAQLLRVGGGRSPAAADCDGLELLGTHHAAKAAGP